MKKTIQKISLIACFIFALLLPAADAQTVGGVAVTTTVTYTTNQVPVTTQTYTTNLSLTATSTNLTILTNTVVQMILQIATNIVTTTGPITGGAVNTAVSNTIAGVSPGGTVAPAPDISTPQGFFSTVLQWSTSFNPTNAYGSNDTLEIWMGTEFVRGINIGALTGFEWRPISSFSGLDLRSVTGWAGVNGVATCQEFTLGYAIQHVDLQVQPFVGGGYNFVSRHDDPNGEAPYLAVGVEISKKMTQRTFLGVGIEERLLNKVGSEPMIFVQTGATFLQEPDDAEWDDISPDW